MKVYNLAAQSHVRVSFDEPVYTANTDALGTLRLLEAIRAMPREQWPKVYQASSAESSACRLLHSPKILNSDLAVPMPVLRYSRIRSL